MFDSMFSMKMRMKRKIIIIGEEEKEDGLRSRYPWHTRTSCFLKSQWTNAKKKTKKQKKQKKHQSNGQRTYIDISPKRTYRLPIDI